MSSSKHCREGTGAGGCAERVEEAAVKIQETTSRSERLSIVIFQRLSVGGASQV